MELRLVRAAPEPSASGNENQPGSGPGNAGGEPSGRRDRPWHTARRRGLVAVAVAALLGLPGTVAAMSMAGDDGTELAMGEEDCGASILEPEDAEFVQANWERAMDIEPIYDEGLDLADEEMEPLVGALGANGIPEVALDAYDNAEDTLATSDPACGVPWSLVAAIGRVESNHGRFGGAQLLLNGYGTRPIRGVPLDGRPGVALVRDTDRGALDDDPVYDRAVGPMQFIPTSWPPVAADGNADAMEDPDNIYDAAIGTAVYLCAGDGDLLGDPDARYRAVFRYNHSDEYVRTVLSLAEMYDEGGALELPYEDPGVGPFDPVDAGAGELGPEVPEPGPRPTTPARPTPPSTTTTVPPRSTTTTTPPTTTPPTTTPPTTTPRPSPTTSTSTTVPDPTTTAPPGSPSTTVPGAPDPAGPGPAPVPPGEVPELDDPPVDPISVGWPQGMNELPPAELPPPPEPPPSDPQDPGLDGREPDAAARRDDGERDPAGDQ